MIPVVDVFAGPGGLNEGFSAFRRDGVPVFSVAASFEMERNAVETLVLRSAVRMLEGNPRATSFYERMLAGSISEVELRADRDFSMAIERSREHVHAVELGPDKRQEVADRIGSVAPLDGEWVLIGGPPCQAYSLVGRSRRAHDSAFDDDHKHFLYREYLDILKRFRPAVFVMENVKGLLSAGHKGTQMFDRIRDDLEQGGDYEIFSLTTEATDPAPRDFVVRAEDHGVPQRRHRVFLVGVRSGSGRRPTRLDTAPVTTVRQAIGDMPHRWAGVSRTTEAHRAWERANLMGGSLAEAWLAGNGHRVINATATRSESLDAWLRKGEVPVSLHEPRRHMESDLARYRFMSELARYGISPRVGELPGPLIPQHKNIKQETVPFVDRFKVQRWDQPGSTVASHIAKDGHYYIHPDPAQMRSLTVREAARLQTFPDDYFFCGPRTAQYHQVGNAVPPLLAHLIAGKVADVLGR